MKRTLASVLAEVQNRTTHIINLIRARTGWRVYYIGSTELRGPSHHTYISAYYIDCWEGVKHDFQSAEFPVFAVYFIVRSDARRASTSAMLCVYDNIKDITAYVPTTLTGNQQTLLHVTNFHIGDAVDWFVSNCISIIKSYAARILPCLTDINFERIFGDFAEFLSKWVSSVLSKRVVFTHKIYQSLSIGMPSSPAMAQVNTRTMKLEITKDTPTLPRNHIIIAASYISEELRAVTFTTKVNIVLEKEPDTHPVKYRYYLYIALSYYDIDTRRQQEFTHEPVQTVRALRDAINRVLDMCKQYITQQSRLHDALRDANEAERIVRAHNDNYTLSDEAIVNAILVTLSRVLRYAFVTYLPMLTGERVFCVDFQYIGHKITDKKNKQVYYKSNHIRVELYPKAQRTEIARTTVNASVDVTIGNLDNATPLKVYAEISAIGMPTVTYTYEQQLERSTPWWMYQFLRNMCAQFMQDVCVLVVQHLSSSIRAQVYKPLAAGDVPVAARLA